MVKGCNGGHVDSFVNILVDELREPSDESYRYFCICAILERKMNCKSIIPMIYC